MGGFGSGRHGGSVTAEDAASYIISISSIATAFRRGECLTGEIHFDKRFGVVVTVDLTNDWNCFVELIHPTRDRRDRDRIVTGHVELTWTTPTYGGRRWWFICPSDGCRRWWFICPSDGCRRTTKLYLPDGGWYFLSRQAYRLGYARQREYRRPSV